MKSELLTVLKDRGFIHQITHEAALDEALTAGPLTLYIGFDATATCLHVGSLVQIMMLRWAQKLGHRPIVLLGGGTTKIGDPSLRDEARQLLDDAAIQSNIEGIKKCFDPFLMFGNGATDARLLNNAAWLSNINYIDFLRDVGAHFSVNRMLSFESVKLRLDREQSLSFLEFNYMILQAYDFFILNRDHTCRLQMGGSDQWGNIVNGVDLTRRLCGQEVFGLTSPLITTSSGTKMGKTANGAVWLSADKLAPYDYWQFWRNTEDADVGRYLRLFTELPLDEISHLEVLKDAEINHAKTILADAATALAHGTACLPTIHDTVSSIFGKDGGQDWSSLPSVTITHETLNAGYGVIEALCALSFASSKGEARRLIQGNGVKVNDATIQDPAHTLSTQDMAPQQGFKISAGKKRHGVLWIK